MRPVRRSSFVRLFLLPSALSLWLSACHSWAPARPPSVELPAQAELPVYERDKLRLVVNEEVVAEGRLAELTSDSVTVSGDDATVVVATGDVSQVYRWETDTGKTVGLSLGIAAGSVLLAVAIGHILLETDSAGY